jgi:hypothetical protein
VSTTESEPAPPIACSLSAADLADRGDEWGELLTHALVSARRTPSGVTLTVQPGAAAELARLVELERTCCPWMRFDFERPEAVAITASGAGVEVLYRMFLAQ